MPKEFVFHVKGSDPDPYIVKVSFSPLNVPAVYDVFASPIKETVSFQGLQKCAGMRRGKERSD
jgi:hypothetical protein